MIIIWNDVNLKNPKHIKMLEDQLCTANPFAFVKGFKPSCDGEIGDADNGLKEWLLKTALKSEIDVESANGSYFYANVPGSVKDFDRRHLDPVVAHLETYWDDLIPEVKFEMEGKYQHYEYRDLEQNLIEGICFVVDLKSARQVSPLPELAGKVN